MNFKRGLAYKTKIINSFIHLSILLAIFNLILPYLKLYIYIITLGPHYNAGFGVPSRISYNRIVL